MRASESYVSVQVSRSQSGSTTTDNKAKIVTGTYSAIDRTFPIFNEMLKTGRVPYVIQEALVIHIFFQIFAVSLWPAFVFLQLTDSWDDIVGLWIYRIAFLSKVSHSKDALTINLIEFTVFILLIFISFAVVVVIYMKTRRFNRISLSIARTCFDIIPSLTFLPCTLWFGICIKYTIKFKETLYIVYSVISFIYVCILTFLHYTQSYFSSLQPYISASHLHCWSGTFYFLLFAVSMLILAFSFITDFFPHYFNILIIAFKLVFNIYISWHTFYFPYSHVYMNSLFFSLCISVSFADITKLLDIIKIHVRFYIIVVIFLISFITCIIISKIVFKSRIKRITTHLSEQARELVSEDDPPVDYATSGKSYLLCTDEQLRKLYHKLRLDKSEIRCEMYFRVGLANRCPMFLNWSVVKFAAEFHHTSHLSTVIAQFISMFPCESRLLSSYFTMACDFPLNFAQRFLLYQIHILKGLRQSSASREIADQMLVLRNKANTIIDDTKKFWVSCPDDLSYFYDIHKRTKYVKELYMEALEKWPNNVKICENYSHFLIEGAMDFKEGVKVYHRAQLIEQGKNFVIDESFRSLVRTYPDYLKKNTMDIRGNFIKQYVAGPNDSQNSSGSRSRGSTISSGTIDGVLDPEIEESLAKSCFTYHRLRIEFQNCVDSRKLKYFGRLKLVMFWSVLLVIFFSCFYFSFYFHHYDQRLGSIQRQININLVKYNFDGSFLVSALLSFGIIGIAHPSFFYENTYKPGSAWEIDLTKNKGAVAEMTDGAAGNLSRFMNDIMSLAIARKDVNTVFYEMIQRVVPTYQCKGLSVLNSEYNLSLKELMVQQLNNMRYLTLLSSIQALLDIRSCELLANLPNVAKYFTNLTSRVVNAIKALEVVEKKVNDTIIISVPLIYTFCVIPILMIYLYLCIRELKYVHNLLKNLNQQVRENSSKPVTYNNDEEENQIKETMRTSEMKNCFFYIIALLPLLNVALFILIPLISISENTKFNTYNFWIYYSAPRSHNAILAYAFTLLAIGSTNPMIGMSARTPFFIKTARSYLDKLDRNNNMLLRGSFDAPSCVGVSDLLDKYNIDKECPSYDPYNSGDHYDYKCSSLDNAITILYAYLNLVLQDPSKANISANSTMSNAFHLINAHLLEKVWLSSYTILKVADDEMKSYRTKIGFICLASLVLGCLSNLILWNVYKKLEIAYKGQIQELKRVPPLSLTSSQQLMNYITHKDDSRKAEIMSPAKSVAYLSNDAVIFVNKTLNIDWINNSTTKLFGYTPDQLLGQPIHTVLPQSHNEELFKQFEMMKNGQCALFYEKEFNGLTDDEQLLPVHVTLIGIPESNNTTPKAFVLILRDESELIEQRKIAEKAKSQSERLLYQILPRDIVSRLNRGETDINFTVPSATVVFIDIVKFSNYASTLSPSQIMEHLSIIFAKFDYIVSKHNLITKIKLIGDVYMAAAGLFSPDENPANHACQVINMGLEGLNALEEANNQFNASLQVRIGVNTNGPLIAGVLGTDKPVFDIIGDPINVAARLQSTAIPGTIQISQETYELIANMNYNLEKRGEIDLKGKGRRMAYIVRPLALSSFFTVPQDIDDK